MAESNFSNGDRAEASWRSSSAAQAIRHPLPIGQTATASVAGMELSVRRNGSSYGQWCDGALGGFPVRRRQQWLRRGGRGGDVSLCSDDAWA